MDLDHDESHTSHECDEWCEIDDEAWCEIQITWCEPILQNTFEINEWWIDHIDDDIIIDFDIDHLHDDESFDDYFICYDG